MRKNKDLLTSQVLAASKRVAGSRRVDALAEDLGGMSDDGKKQLLNVLTDAEAEVVRWKRRARGMSGEPTARWSR